MRSSSNSKLVAQIVQRSRPNPKYGKPRDPVVAERQAEIDAQSALVLADAELKTHQFLEYAEKLRVEGVPEVEVDDNKSLVHHVEVLRARTAK